jgi:hypothetical protein
MSVSSSIRRPFERFGAASLSSQSETRLQKSKQLVTTSISPSGWLAAASSKHVCLYNVKEANRSQDIPSRTALAIKLHSGEQIRAVALSEDLLAVLTHNRLLVYDEYRTSDDPAGDPFDERSIGQDHSWTPWSVSIVQTGTAAMGEGAVASVAVGGTSVDGVKLFRYIYKNCWNVQEDRMTLRCPGNNGAVKVVGFSPFRSNAIYGSMVFALTTGNRLYCWRVDQSPGVSTRKVQPIWHLDCNPRSNQCVSQFQSIFPLSVLTNKPILNEISSADLIISPTARLYMLCTVDHQKPSHLSSTFTVPVDMLENNPLAMRHRMRPFSDNVVGPNVLAGAASPNGHFLVVVESGRRNAIVKVLTLQGMQDGGLTCSARVQMWASRLRANRTHTSAISISIEEEEGALEVVIVDGQGHIGFARISVPDMPAYEPSRPLSLRRSTILGLPQSPPMLAGELSSEESSRRSASTRTMDEMPG